jgi:hypothetical protein
VGWCHGRGVYFYGMGSRVLGLHGTSSPFSTTLIYGNTNERIYGVGSEPRGGRASRYRRQWIMSISILNSQFSILNSQFSILNSQFSILNSHRAMEIWIQYLFSQLKPLVLLLTTGSTPPRHQLYLRSCRVCLLLSVTHSPHLI